MDSNTEHEISVEYALAEAEFLRNVHRILEQMHTKISSMFIEEIVSNDDKSKSSGQYHSPDSGYLSEKIAHPFVIENETNDNVEMNEVLGIELDYNDIDEPNTESTIEPSEKSMSVEQVRGFYKLIILLSFALKLSWLCLIV